MKEILLITGLTGRTGTCFLKEIEEHSDFFDRYDLVAVVRETSDTAAIDACSVPIRKVKGDLKDASFCRTILRDADLLLHIAGIHYSLPLIPIAAQKRLKRIIAVHTTGIYSKFKAAGEEYRTIDRICENVCSANQVPLTVLRPTMIYGGIDDCNMVAFIRMIDTLPFIPVVNGGKYTLQPVHRSDLAHAYYLVFLHSEHTSGRSYVLSGEAPLLLREILAVIAENLSKPARFISVPFWFAFAGAWFLYCVSLTRIDVREKVQRLTEDRSFPHDEASSDMGFMPRSFRQGIRAEVEEYLHSRKNERIRKR